MNAAPQERRTTNRSVSLRHASIHCATIASASDAVYSLLELQVIVSPRLSTQRAQETNTNWSMTPFRIWIEKLKKKRREQNLNTNSESGFEGARGRTRLISKCLVIWYPSLVR